MLLNAATRWRSAEVMKRKLVDERSSNAARRSRRLYGNETRTQRCKGSLQILLDVAGRWGSRKVTKRDLVVASTRHHHAGLLKYYPRLPCVPSFVKSRMLHPLQTHFLLFQQIFFVLICIHPGNAMVPPRVSGPKTCREYMFFS